MENVGELSPDHSVVVMTAYFRDPSALTREHEKVLIEERIKLDSSHFKLSKCIVASNSKRLEKICRDKGLDFFWVEPSIPVTLDMSRAISRLVSKTLAQRGFQNYLLITLNLLEGSLDYSLMQKMVSGVRESGMAAFTCSVVEVPFGDWWMIDDERAVPLPELGGVLVNADGRLFVEYIKGNPGIFSAFGAVYQRLVRVNNEELLDSFLKKWVCGPIPNVGGLGHAKPQFPVTCYPILSTDDQKALDGNCSFCKSDSVEIRSDRYGSSQVKRSDLPFNDPQKFGESLTTNMLSSEAYGSASARVILNRNDRLQLTGFIPYHREWYDHLLVGEERFSLFGKQIKTCDGCINIELTQEVSEKHHIRIYAFDSRHVFLSYAAGRYRDANWEMFDLVSARARSSIQIQGTASTLSFVPPANYHFLTFSLFRPAETAEELRSGVFLEELSIPEKLSFDLKKLVWMNEDSNEIIVSRESSPPTFRARAFETFERDDSSQLPSHEWSYRFDDEGSA